MGTAGLHPWPLPFCLAVFKAAKNVIKYPQSAYNVTISKNKDKGYKLKAFWGFFYLYNNLTLNFILII